MFIGRVLSGITAASFSTAGAYIADVTPPDKRAGSYGMLGASFGLGFVIGPAFGGVLGEYDFVTVMDAPSNEVVARISVELGARGTMRITTIPAISVSAFTDLLKQK